MAAAAVAPGSPAQRAAVAAAERRRLGLGAAAEEPHARAASFGAHGTDRDNEQRFGGGVRMADYAASEAAAAAAAALDMARGGAVSGAATAYGARPAWTSSASAAGSGSGSMQGGGAAAASASAYRPSSRVVNDRGGIGAARGATATAHGDEISGAGTDGISPRRLLVQKARHWAFRLPRNLEGCWFCGCVCGCVYESSAQPETQTRELPEFRQESNTRETEESGFTPR